MIVSTATVGTASGTTGALLFKGTTSGTVTLSVADAAGTYTLKLPTTDGDSGQFLQTDGSGNTSWATASSTSNKIRMSTIFETAGRFTDNSSSGTTTFNSTGMLLDTTATGTRSAVKYLDVGSNTFEAYDSSPTFTAIFTNINENSVGTAVIGIGNVGITGASPVLTDSHIGFKVVTTGGVSTLYVTIANGGVETATSALTTIGGVSVIMEVIAVVTSATAVSFYWRKSGGALSAATTLTTTLPSSTDDVPLFFGITNEGNANSCTLTMISASYER